VIKDLIKGDACQEELIQTRTALDLTERKSVLQQRIIDNLNEQELKSIGIIDLKDGQLEAQDRIIRDREKQFRRQKAVSWIYKVGTFAGAAGIGYLLLR
jgi:hypothetical protein